MLGVPMRELAAYRQEDLRRDAAARRAARAGARRPARVRVLVGAALVRAGRRIAGTREPGATVTVRSACA